MWETIQQAISSNAKTARFLVIIAGLLALAVLACHALGSAAPEILRTVIVVMRNGT